MRKFAVCFLLLASLGTLPAVAWGEEDLSQAADKAREYHTLASSDVIYTQDEMKALYFQNIQIIDLLTQIRDLLDRKLQTEKQ